MAIRIGTFGFQKALAAGMLKSQDRAAASQLELATGKKAQTYRELGGDLRPSLSARSVIAAEKAHGAVAGRVGQVLERYSDSLSALHDQVSALRTVVGQAISSGEAHGIDTELAATFSALRSATNLSQGGEYLMSGLSVDVRPFTPATIEDLEALPSTADAFVNSDVPLSARVAEGTDLAYGLTADTVGRPVADMLVELKGMAVPEGKLSDAALADLTDFFRRTKAVTDGIADLQARNGQRQTQIDAYGEQAVARTNQLESFVTETEDVELTEVITRLQSEQLALQASYQAFALFRETSLVNYLR